MFRSIILGIVQGIGEFLPISSSAHLILIRYLFGWPEMTTAFDVSLHVGTLLAVLFMYYKEWLELFQSALDKIIKDKNSVNSKMFFYIIIATIPGVISGLLLDNIIEKTIRTNILLIAILLSLMGIMIYIGDKWSNNHYKNPTEYKDIKLSHSIIIGLSQSLAIIPGFSRSGVTILAARLLGISREASTKFTFMLSVPIIAGAAILKINDLVLSIKAITGIMVSFLVGTLSINFLTNYIKKHDFSIFAIYRIIITSIILIKYFTN